MVLGGCSNSTTYSGNGHDKVSGRISLTLAVSPQRRTSFVPILTISPVWNAIVYVGAPAGCASYAPDIRRFLRATVQVHSWSAQHLYRRVTKLVESTESGNWEITERRNRHLRAIYPKAPRSDIRV